VRCIDRKRFVYGLVGIAVAGCTPQPVRPPAVPDAPPAAQARPPAPPATAITLPTPETARSWEQLRLQAARRMIAANPEGSYTSVAPEVLLAIPVLEIELNADGSVRRIEVLRHPRQARDTTQLAIDAVRRAAPFGDVSRLTRPWKFTEAFLFDDDRRFKPRSLD
jgi:hypothetical protein